MQPTRPELSGTFGMVSATHWLAAGAGMATLEAGGNAVDAAVAAGFALQVAEPHLNGPGGDMTLLFAGPDGPPTVLCGQGGAPDGPPSSTSPTSVSTWCPDRGWWPRRCRAARSRG